MSDDGGEDESQQDSKKFFVDRAKSGRATCKKCKEKLNSGDLRLAKSGYNPFGPGPMKMWHHVNCLFDVFSRQRPTTAKIETPDDIEGWSDLDEEDQEEILKYLPKCKGWKPTPKAPKDDTPKKAKVASTKTSKEKEKEKEKDKDKDKEKEKDKDKERDKEKKKDSGSSAKEGHKDDSFREFRRLCAALSETQSYTGKTALIKEFFTKGTDGSSFKGDLNLWCRLLLPGTIKRVYNLQSKQLIKLFSKIFHTDQDDMLEDLEQGDVAETVRVFFEKSKHLSPTKKSNLQMQDVDKFLEELSGMTKEDEQSYHFKQMAKKCTSNDLKMIIRLVKHDLRINAGPKHILEAVHPDAYQAFQTSQDLDAVLAKAVVKTESGHSSPTKKTNIKITASVMTPVLPMLPKTNGDEGGEENEAETNGNEHSDNKTKIVKKRSVSSDNDDSQTTKKPRIMKNGKSDSEEKESDPQKINSQETENDTKAEQDEDDEYTIFGNYVAHEIRSLTCEENKRELKRIIQKAIIDMGEMDDKKDASDPQP